MEIKLAEIAHLINIESFSIDPCDDEFKECCKQGIRPLTFGSLFGTYFHITLDLKNKTKRTIPFVKLHIFSDIDSLIRKNYCDTQIDRKFLKI